MNRLPIISNVDRIGAGLSLICAVHCLLMPFFFAVLPFLGLEFLHDGLFEAGMLVVALGFAAASLYWGVKLHGRYDLILYIGLGILFFTVAHEYEEHYLHGVLMGFGGLSLATGHLINRRLCRECHACHCAECAEGPAPLKS